jgi:hypothetical protein
MTDDSSRAAFQLIAVESTNSFATLPQSLITATHSANMLCKLEGEKATYLSLSLIINAIRYRMLAFIQI